MIFGDLPISAKELVDTLNHRATKLASERDPREMNTAWTYGIMQALAEMAGERGLTPLIRPQFILDAVWWQEDKQAAVLGVESEWGNPRDRSCKGRADCVHQDFEKLLQFKAPMKLMIFSADDAEMRLAIHEVLVDRLRAFSQHVAGETYVFVEFSAGRCLSYTCEIKEHGRDASLSLKAMSAESERLLAPVAAKVS